MVIQNKKIIVFDLDGTLAESRCEIKSPMPELLKKLLKIYKAGILSGGSFDQIISNVINKLDNDSSFNNLILLPTCGSSFHSFNNNAWHQLYSVQLSEKDKLNIIEAITECLGKVSFSIDKVWGEQFQDKGTQITFSALGDKSPTEIKKNWDIDFKKRSELREAALLLLPNLEVKMGGTTSLDITNKGIDKAFGIKKIEEHLNINKDQILFVGDALIPGGNDYAVKEYGVDCISVNNPDDTIKVIRTILLAEEIKNGNV